MGECVNSSEFKDNIHDRQRHRLDVEAFLRKHFSSQAWVFELPQGSGNETYLAHSSGRSCFVKLGAQASRYQAMAAIGLTPEVLAAGYLEDGASIIVQPCIAGRKPGRREYRIHLEQFAGAVQQMHQSPDVRRALPQVSSEMYRSAGVEALDRVQQRWECFKGLVPQSVNFVDESLIHLREQVMDFQDAGLVASHNDICNANWLITPTGQLYLLDFEAMSIDDPAADIGATLWWYYPPELRQRFLQIVGHANDAAFEYRMQVRMAIHCLSITLPRPQSFDRFDAGSFGESLSDFRALLSGEENPQGYND